MESAPFVPSTSSCSLSSWLTSYCAHHSPHLRSQHLLFPRPFTPDLKLIYFTNPFLHSLSLFLVPSGLPWRILNLYRTKLTLACVSVSFLTFFVSGYMCKIKLTTLSLLVHVKLFYRIVSYSTAKMYRPSSRKTSRLCVGNNRQPTSLYIVQALGGYCGMSRPLSPDRLPIAPTT